MMEPGTYVLATKWGDGDPGDEWAIGFYDRMLRDDRYIIVRDDGTPFRANGFRRAEPITGRIGDFILARKELIQASQRSLWDWLEDAKAAPP